MIKRIVRLSLQTEKIQDFVELFYHYKAQIRASKGCTHLELWRDVDHPNVFFTYSYWEKVEDLNAYRHSDFFNSIWPETKAMLAEKPLAWSVQVMEPSLPDKNKNGRS